MVILYVLAHIKHESYVTLRKKKVRNSCRSIARINVVTCKLHVNTLSYRINLVYHRIHHERGPGPFMTDVHSRLDHING